MKLFIKRENIIKLLGKPVSLRKNGEIIPVRNLKKTRYIYNLFMSRPAIFDLKTGNIIL